MSPLLFCIINFIHNKIGSTPCDLVRLHQQCGHGHPKIILRIFQHSKKNVDKLLTSFLSSSDQFSGFPGYLKSVDRSTSFISY
jgi:hypothetical protein